MYKAIINTHIVLLDSLILNGTLLIENDTIIDFGENIIIPEDAFIIDANGLYCAPGFIDIHTHAGNGIWYHDDPQAVSSFHLSHGTTTVLPALYFNMTKEEYLDAIKKIRNDSLTGDARIIEGLYMEGPYLNPKFGCDSESNQWMGDIEKTQYIEVIEEAGEFAKIWALAPERDGIENFVLDVKKVCSDPIFTVAHSEATPSQVYKYLPHGLKIGTHHTNATGDLPKYPECRGVCVDEAVNYSDEIYAELICDSKGIHVDPFMLRLVLKIKGRDKVLLISDTCVFNGPVPEGYDGVTDINFDYAGQIAGSKLTLDVAAQNMLKHTGSGICDIFRFASYNPSRLLNLDSVGCIQKGRKANLVLVDHLINVKQVLFQGEIVK